MYDIIAEAFVYIFAVVYIVLFVVLFQKWIRSTVGGNKKKRPARE
jgi:hypothetical protein